MKKNTLSNNMRRFNTKNILKENSDWKNEWKDISNIDTKDFTNVNHFVEYVQGELEKLKPNYQPTDEDNDVPTDDVNTRTVKFEDIDPKDYPKFTDAFISYAEFDNGTPLTEDQLEWLMQNEHSWVYERLQDYLY